MVRLASTEPAREPREVTWLGTPASARRITAWSADPAGNIRFQWNPNHHDPDHARTLVEYPPVTNPAGATIQAGKSSEWVLTPVGSTIYRDGDSEDAPLRVVLPADPVQVFEEQAA